MSNIIHFKNGKFLPVTENWIYSQVLGIKNYHPIIYCNGLKNSELFPYKDIRIFGRYYLPHQVMSYSPRLYFSLLKDKPVLVHAHMGSSGLTFLTYKRIFKVPLITAVYGIDISSSGPLKAKNKKLYKPLFSQGEIFLAMGKYMKKQLLELNCPEEKIIIQPLGIPVKNIAFQQRKFDAKGPLKIIIAARFTEKKGLPDAIAAIGIAKQIYPKLKVKVTLVGDSNKTPEDEREKKLILEVTKRFELSNLVKYVGTLDHPELIKQFYNHHLFLSPSITATSGDNEGGYLMSSLEASATGMATISTRHCDIPDTIINGKTGYLVPEKSPIEIAKCIIKMVKSPDSFTKMGYDASKHVKNNYDNDLLINRLEQIYDQTIKRWNRR